MYGAVGTGTPNNVKFLEEVQKAGSKYPVFVQAMLLIKITFSDPDPDLTLLLNSDPLGGYLPYSGQHKFFLSSGC